METQLTAVGGQRHTQRDFETSSPLRMIDSFQEDRPPGRVVGSTNSSGFVRLGRDMEDAFSIDNGALRIRCLRDPGWGRASLAYGPFPAVPGLALAITALNGLTTSQTHDLPEPRKARLARVVRTRRIRRPDIHESLALGWFGAAIPASLPASGPSFVTHAHPEAVGELWASGEGGRTRLVHSLQNIPLTLVTVIRHGDAALYASSLPGAHGFPGHPWLRPLALVPLPHGLVYAGIHQSVLGEVHYELDTRVYRVQVEPLSQLASWYSSAHAADLLMGAGDLADSPAEVGGRWSMLQGGFTRGVAGVAANGQGGRALLNPGQPSGLVQLQLEAGGAPAPVSLLWRADGDGRAWQVELSGAGAQLIVDGRRADTCDDWRLRPNSRHTVHVLDDGDSVGAYLDGQLLFDRWFSDEGHAAATSVGFGVEGPSHDMRLRRFEAHPRRVRIPASLDTGPPWIVTSSDVVVADTFDGNTGDLHGTRAQDGRLWRRVWGKGAIDRTGSGDARVRADLQSPNPGRTIYIVPWEHPSFADLAVTVTPPGSARRQGHRGRSGLAFWQDEDNYLLVNHFLDDTSVGVSISCFLRVLGQEQMCKHDATWSNVGGRIRHGEPFRLRIVCDGARFLVFLDGEPVHYRALSDYKADAPRLEIRGGGMTANWEWGDDTGSHFDEFVARGPRGRHQVVAELPTKLLRERLRG